MPDEPHDDPVRGAIGDIDALLRMGLASGLQLTERWAQGRLTTEASARQQREQYVKRLEARQRAQHEAARALWQRSQITTWWEHATDAQIATSHQAASDYATSDPSAADALVRMEQELAGRYLEPQRDTPAEERFGTPETEYRENAQETHGRENGEPDTGDLARWTEAVGPDVADDMIGAGGWPTLAARLSAMDVAGLDSAEELKVALGRRDLEGVTDVAAVLNSRLTDTEDRADQRRTGPASVKDSEHAVRDLVGASMTGAGSAPDGPPHRPAGSAHLSAEEVAATMAGHVSGPHRGTAVGR